MSFSTWSQRAISPRQETLFTPEELTVGAQGERARTLAEARRVQAAVESMISLLQVMEQPTLAGPGGVEYSLPYVLDARARRAVAGDVKSVSTNGSTYGWTADPAGQTFTLSNSQAHKTVHVSNDGTWTYIEEHKVRLQPALRPRSLAFA